MKVLGADRMQPPGYGRPEAVFTVDVEDWFQVSAFDAHVDRSGWDGLESRVERNTDLLLGLLADAGATGTFFTLGWVAERMPQLVRRIAEAGHEVASHGYGHERITSLREAAFRADVRRARAVLEDACGAPVVGYRAPSFSLTDDVPWAARVLVEEGHAYDSSRFPIRRRGYGSADAPSVPHMLETDAGPLREYPPAVWAVSGLRVPVAGGGWFRQLPLGVIRRGLRAVLDGGQPAVFYIHPWELDPGQPRVAGIDVLTRIRHYRGLASATGRLRALLADFRFVSVRELAAT